MQAPPTAAFFNGDSLGGGGCATLRGCAGDDDDDDFRLQLQIGLAMLLATLSHCLEFKLKKEKTHL